MSTCSSDHNVDPVCVGFKEFIRLDICVMNKDSIIIDYILV